MGGRRERNGACLACGGVDGSIDGPPPTYPIKSIQPTTQFTDPPTQSDQSPRQGGHWECRRDFELPVLDRIWTNTVLGACVLYVFIV